MNPGRRRARYLLYVTIARDNSTDGSSDGGEGEKKRLGLRKNCWLWGWTLESTYDLLVRRCIQ